VDNKRGELVHKKIPLDSEAVSPDSRVEPILSGVDGLAWLCFVSFVHNVKETKPIYQLKAKGK